MRDIGSPSSTSYPTLSLTFPSVPVGALLPRPSTPISMPRTGFPRVFSTEMSTYSKSYIGSPKASSHHGPQLDPLGDEGRKLPIDWFWFPRTTSATRQYPVP